MTHYEYITKHLWRCWIQSWSYNFRIWADLMTSNYETYHNPYGESDEVECYEWFWSSINMDDTYTKEFLEEMCRLMEEVQSGKVKTVPAEDVLKMFEETLE